MFRSQACFEGSILLKDHGVCKCSSPCSIHPSLSPPFKSGSDSFFSFLALSFDDDVLPQIQFGLKDDTSEIVCLSYSTFISSYRISVPELPISIDGLGCSVRLSVSRGQFTVHLADHPVYTLSVSGAPRIFLRITAGKCTLLTPFGLPPGASSWFPALLPVQWRLRDQSLLIRRFHVRKIHPSDSDAVFAYTTARLRPLPGTSILYFEADVRDFAPSDAGFSFSLGFICRVESFTNFAIGQDKHSLGFHTAARAIVIGQSATATGLPPVATGDSVGIGLDLETGRVFATLNGASADADCRLAHCAPEFRAIFGLASRADEVELNFGQRPFRFAGLAPPAGWALYEAPRADGLSRGPRAFGHVAGYYRELGGPAADSLLGRAPLADGARFEVTLARLTPVKSLALGVGAPAAPGVRLGVQCEDGLMLDGDHPGAMVVQPAAIEEGATIGLRRAAGRFEFTVNSRAYDLPTRQELARVHPLATFRGATFAVFVNLGAFPFAAEHPAGGGDGDAELFNRVRAPMGERGLDEFGLARGDVVESRDRLFTGRVLGVFRGRPFFQVPGIDGAVCLDCGDPLFHRMLLRVVARPAADDCWSPIVVLDGFARVNVGARAVVQPMALVGGPCGVCLSAGSDAAGRPVVRPVADLLSSANGLVLTDARAGVIGARGHRFRDVECVFFRRHAVVWPLDIVTAADASLCVVVGYRGEVAVAFDGTKLVDISHNVLPLFRFVGYDKGVLFGQSMLYSVAAASFVRGGLFAFTNEFCGVYGNHVVPNQTEKLTAPPVAAISAIPPFVGRILKTLCEDPEPVLVKVRVHHAGEDDFFYECEAPEDAPRIAGYLERPGVLTDLNGSGH